MKDVNLEIVHEVNVRLWRRRLAWFSPASHRGKFLLFFLIPTMLAWALA
ncbi:MAG: hypothetical protein R3318_02995 [Gammaproteobacteria bacterium]|nr:hypothetical protein [Gammaproteobacteria bacterium]